MSCVVECPYCGEELIFDMTENIGAQITELWCPECEKISNIKVAEFLCQYN